MIVGLIVHMVLAIHLDHMLVQYQMVNNHHLDIHDDVNDLQIVLVELMDHMNMNHNSHLNVVARKQKNIFIYFIKSLFKLLHVVHNNQLVDRNFDWIVD